MVLGITIELSGSPGSDYGRSSVHVKTFTCITMSQRASIRWMTQFESSGRGHYDWRKIFASLAWLVQT
ncbi:hypothetical protein RRG08_039374 [Elysia crispata]|uniref:Uncharacterized protein n=1 Tax=Elysia crispata TaxID=231223 RepID=A0AAE0XWH9_9GAST|nr:hypothetical protein RRG08_039374 [Elysia crispata]